MPLLLVWALFALPPPPPLPALADDLPPGTDIGVRLALGEVLPMLAALEDDLKPIAAGSPEVAKALASLSAERDHPTLALLRRLGLDPLRKGAVLTVAIDLLPKGPPLIAMVLRGAGGPLVRGAPEGLEERPIEGEHALVDVRAQLAVAEVGPAVVLGDERAVGRMIRHLRGARTTSPSAHVAPDVRELARTLRRPAVLQVAALSVPELRRASARAVPAAAAMAATIRGVTITVDATSLELWLQVDDAKKREGVAAAIRAVVAALNASGQGLLALGELATAAPDLVPSRALGPQAVDAQPYAPLLRRWLDGFRLTPEVRVRPAGVEAHVAVSSYRGLVAAMAGFIVLGRTVLAHLPTTASPPGDEATPEPGPVEPPADETPTPREEEDEDRET